MKRELTENINVLPEIFDIIDWKSFDIVFQFMFAMGCIQLFKMEHIMLQVMIQKHKNKLSLGPLG